MAGFILSLFILFVTACSSAVKDNAIVNRENIVIRYFSLSVVYNSISETDVDFKMARIRQDEIIMSIKSLEEDIFLSENRKDLMKRYSGEKERLEKADKNVIYHKARILNRVNKAVKITAERIGADYILNINDDAVYGKKKFDITEEIIREIMKMDELTSPSVR